MTEWHETQSPSANGAVSDDLEVIVIGGGQAGLAIGYFLAQQGRNFAILEAAEEPAAAWRARWDSLKLFTPARYSRLPGLPFPGDPDSYPGRDEVVAYLTEYARHFALPVVLGSRVRAIRRAEGRYLVELDEPQLYGRSGRGRYRTVPGPVRAADRGRPRSRRLPAPQHPVPGAGGPSRWSGAGRRWRQHRLSDRRRALRHPRGSPVDRVAANAATSADPRSRPVLVSREDRL